MVNDDADYKAITITEDMLDNDYEPVVVNVQEESNFDGYENNEEVREIYDTDLIIEQTSSVWHHNSIRFLIYCWSQLREQFSICPDKKKKALWEHVSKSMVERSYYFDAKACETKWRSLKKVYMYNKTRNPKKDGTKHIIVWAHYCDMDRAIKGIPYDISDINDDEENNVNIDDDHDLRESANNNCTSTKNTNATSGRDDNNHISQWTIETTRELIRMYGKYRKKFSAIIQGGKHLLWEEIAQQFARLGYHYPANTCNDKWRNLKMTFKKNKQRVSKYGPGYTKWFYYKDMDNVIKGLSDETPDFDDIITVSLNDYNELVDTKIKCEEHYNTNFQTPDDEIIENNDGEENTEIWTEAATKCLIELWGLYRPRFLMAAQGKKRLLWNEISDQLRKNGHNYSSLVCDRKWRLLKANYLKRKEKYKKLGDNSVKWQYYQDLDRLLGIPVETISWNMDSTMCLIDCFDRHKEKFMQAATGEKLLIWKEISEQMSENGFHYSPRACDNKWRTLKNRYNKNRMRSNRNKKVIWVYYNKIDSVLRDISKDKMLRGNETNNTKCETNDNEEHNYIKVKPNSCSFKTEAIIELKDMFKLRNAEFDQKLKDMEDVNSQREKVSVDLQQQTLNALNRSNELEAHKLRLLEQLISILPQSSSTS